MKRIIVGISGASGAGLGLRFLKALPGELEKYCVISNGAKQVLLSEEGRKEYMEFDAPLPEYFEKLIKSVLRN